MDGNEKTSLSMASSYEEMGKYWDNHDFTEVDDPNAADVEFQITCTVPIEPNLLSDIEKQAHTRGISVETLVNLWLQQKLNEQTA